MQSFEWVDATSVEQAATLLAATPQLRAGASRKPAAWICST